MPLDAAMSPLKRHLEKIGEVMKKRNWVEHRAGRKYREFCGAPS
jgi:hypothetical protein